MAMHRPGVSREGTEDALVSVERMARRQLSNELIDLLSPVSASRDVKAHSRIALVHHAREHAGI